MKKITIGTTSVYLEPIEPEAAPSPRGSRRQREKEAVGRIAHSLGIAIGHDPDGAPTTEGANVSISHSMRLAALAIDPFRQVGIDAEECRDALWRVRPKFLSSRECEELIDAESLLWAWTAKEAVYKAAPNPRPQMTQIECLPSENAAMAMGRRYSLKSWMEGSTRVTLAYTNDAD